MKGKRKKLIILLVSIIATVLVGVVGFFVFSNLATTTVNDLRIVDAKSGKEISEKEVFITSQNNNSFTLKLKTDLSYSSFRVVSLNPEIAKITSNKGVYTVTYLKAGTTKIVATTIEPSNVKDTLVLKVKDFLPTEFYITDENAISNDEVEIFADDREYRFKFDAVQGMVDKNINKSSISVVDNYDKNVFKSVKIDAQSSELILSAHQSEYERREIVTLQVKSNGAVVDNFVVKVKIKGNYISDIQLMLSNTPNFTNSKYIYGEGLLKEDETRVNTVVLTEEVFTVYAKVRIVYTNGEMFDVTQDVTAENTQGSYANISRPQLSDYYSIDIRRINGGNTTLGSAEIKFAYSGKDTPVYFAFNYLPTNEEGYKNFLKNSLYKENIDYNGYKTYKYVYWDNRFERLDVITDADGNIIGFDKEIN